MRGSKAKNRTITSVAASNGFALELGVSPLGRVTSELVSLSPFLTVEFSNLITGLLLFGTFLDLTIGLKNIWEWGGRLGALAFIIGFAGGAVLLYYPLGGVLCVAFALFLAEVAPTSKW